MNGSNNITTFPTPTVYTNMTQTASGSLSSATQPLDIFALVWIGFLFSIGVFGNLLTIFILGFVRKGATNAYNLLLIFLSVIDLICSAIVPSMFAYGTLTKFKSWVFGLVGCKILLPILPINVTISQGILMLMSIDRYRVISKPFERSGLTKNQVTIFTALFGLLGVILASPYIYSMEILDDPRTETKTCISPGNKTLYMLSYACINVTRDIIATTILAVSAWKVGRVLVANSRNMSKHDQEGKRMARRFENINSTRRMLRLMLIVFSVCTIPLDAYQVSVYVSFMILKDGVSPSAYIWIRSANTVLYLLQTSNAAVNIFIYGARHRDFRPILKRFSTKKKELFYKVFPKVDGASFEGSRSGSSEDVLSKKETSETSVRGRKITQFNFDSFFGERN